MPDDFCKPPEVICNTPETIFKPPEPIRNALEDYLGSTLKAARGPVTVLALQQPAEN